ncbi:hypothetical protein M378DRAFT_13673, partial [Amanita muscaria Koide BX008]
TAESADDSHVSPPSHTSFDATKAAWRTANSDIESADDARVGLPLGTSFEATKAVWRSHHTNASADGLDISLAGSSDYSRSAEDDQHDHQVGAFDQVAAAYRTRSITASAGAEDGYSGAEDPHSSDQSSSGSLCVPEAELRLTPHPYDAHYFDFFDESWLPDIDGTGTAENMCGDNDQDQGDEGHFI